MPSEIDTSYTDEIVCPWCGRVHKDSWEMEDGKQWRGECGKRIHVARNETVTYTTTKGWGQ